MMGVLNDQKTRTFTQHLSNAVVQHFNDFWNKIERERGGRRKRVTMTSVLNRMKNN